jgi:hypothetical protein
VQAQDQWYVADGVAQRARRAKAKDAMARWRDGATHHLMSPLEFMQRKACGAGAKTTPSLNPISRSAGTECEVALKGSTAGAK